MSADVATVVTDRIIAALENGTVPWSRPWSRVQGYGPTSLSSGKEYRGVNNLILECESMVKGYGSPFWATFNQAKAHGGAVRKGEKATPIVLWKPVDKKPEKEGDDPGKYLLMLYFNVFNAEQCDGIEVPEIEVLPDIDPIEAAERIANGMPARPQVRNGGDRAYYSPTLDYVQMPPGGAFASADDYYLVLLHELAHSTGHSSRLNRDGIETASPFGSETYAKEELVAEIASAILAGSSGIAPNIERSAAYCKSWLSWASDNRKALVSAASQAQKAADYVLGV